MTTHFPSCPKLGLYAVIPSADWVEKLVSLSHQPKTKVGAIQLREKLLSGTALMSEIKRAVAVAKSSSIPLFINDYWREAIDAGAYGVHLGQEDLDQLSTVEFEQLTKSGLRLGVSTHSKSELHRALMLRPSYVAMGAIFATTTKVMPTAPQGLDNLRVFLEQVFATKNDQRLISETWLPRTVAIGGIFVDNAAKVLATGVESIALVRAITEAKDPKLVIKQLNSIFLKNANKGALPLFKKR